MENKGIRNKSDFIRNLVIFYLDLTGDDFTSLQEWRDFVEALTD